MFQLYKLPIDSIEDRFLILGGPTKVGEWYFDQEEHNEHVGIEDWMLALAQVDIIITLAKEIFSVDFVNATLIPLNGVDEFSVEYKLSSSPEKAINALRNFVDPHETRSIKIVLVGNCLVGQDSLRCELFALEVERNNSVSISLTTNNFCFLPHHPYEKKRQYDIWKQNAVPLAKLLLQFELQSPFPLLTEPGERIGFLSSISDNKYFLSNGPIIGVEDDTWDEFHVPFELLSENDYKLFFSSES